MAVLSANSSWLAGTIEPIGRAGSGKDVILFFVGISLGCVKNYFRSCSTMKRVEPAPTISPMMYAIRILVIWFFFLGWLFVFPFAYFGCSQII
jgi:hypothetical protein